MGYYNVEHPDYYALDTEECGECGEEFMAKKEEFFCEFDERPFVFCCEECLRDFLICFFKDVASDYDYDMEEINTDYNFICSHPKIVESEFEEVKNASV